MRLLGLGSSREVLSEYSLKLNQSLKPFSSLIFFFQQSLVGGKPNLNTEKDGERESFKSVSPTSRVSDLTRGHSLIQLRDVPQAERSCWVAAVTGGFWDQLAFK